MSNEQRASSTTPSGSVDSPRCSSAAGSRIAVDGDGQLVLVRPDSGRRRRRRRRRVVPSGRSRRSGAEYDERQAGRDPRGGERRRAASSASRIPGVEPVDDPGRARGGASSPSSEALDRLRGAGAVAEPNHVVLGSQGVARDAGRRRGPLRRRDDVHGRASSTPTIGPVLKTTSDPAPEPAWLAAAARARRSHARRRCSSSTPGCAPSTATGATRRAPVPDVRTPALAVAATTRPSRPIDDEDEFDDDESGTLDFEAGHGTFITGIIQQICPDAEVHIAGVLSSFGDGDVANVIAAFERGRRQAGPFDIVVMSLGGYMSDDDGELFGAALRRLLGDGLGVSAAGNQSTSRPYFPAALPDDRRRRRRSAQDDKAWFTNFGGWVDACAPAIDVVSTFFRRRPERRRSTTRRSPGWARWSGTSFAAPKVAGVDRPGDVPDRRPARDGRGSGCPTTGATGSPTSAPCSTSEPWRSILTTTTVRSARRARSWRAGASPSPPTPPGGCASCARTRSSLEFDDERASTDVRARRSATTRWRSSAAPVGEPPASGVPRRPARPDQRRRAQRADAVEHGRPSSARRTRFADDGCRVRPNQVYLADGVARHFRHRRRRAARAGTPGAVSAGVDCRRRSAPAAPPRATSPRRSTCPGHGAPNVLVLDTGLRTARRRASSTRGCATTASCTRRGATWRRSGRWDDEDEPDDDAPRPPRPPGRPRHVHQRHHPPAVPRCRHPPPRRADELRRRRRRLRHRRHRAGAAPTAATEHIDIVVMAFGTLRRHRRRPPPMAGAIRRLLERSARRRVGRQRRDVPAVLPGRAPRRRRRRRARRRPAGGVLQLRAVGRRVHAGRRRRQHVLHDFDDRRRGRRAGRRRYRGWARWSGTSFAAPKVAGVDRPGACTCTAARPSEAWRAAAPTDAHVPRARPRRRGQRLSRRPRRRRRVPRWDGDRRRRVVRRGSADPRDRLHREAGGRAGGAGFGWLGLRMPSRRRARRRPRRLRAAGAGDRRRPPQARPPEGRAPRRLPADGRADGPLRRRPRGGRVRRAVPLRRARLHPQRPLRAGRAAGRRAPRPRGATPSASPTGPGAVLQAALLHVVRVLRRR